MAGNFSQHGIQQIFCIKDNAAGGSEFWPEGKYCIYKKGKRADRILKLGYGYSKKDYRFGLVIRMCAYLITLIIILIIINCKKKTISSA